jgi:two-component system, LytTR family, response regulator
MAFRDPRLAGCGLVFTIRRRDLYAPTPQSDCRMTFLRALVIDEVGASVTTLRGQLQDHKDVVVAGEASQLGRARTLLSVPNYDIVFFNPGGEAAGLELLPAIRPGARIIFVATHAAHALQAFEVGAVDYLLKPVEPRQLARALDRARRGIAAESAGSVSPFATINGLLPIKVGPVTRLLRLAELRSIVSCQNYTQVLLVTGERLTVRRTMQQWADALPAPQFARVHRSLMINVAHVSRTERAPARQWKVHFTGHDSLPLIVKRRHWPALRAKIAHSRCADAAIAPADACVGMRGTTALCYDDGAAVDRPAQPARSARSAG